MDTLIVNEAAEPDSQTSNAGAIGSAPLLIWIINITVLVVPFLALGWGIYYSWGTFGGVELTLLLSMYALTVWGITVGFHRLFTHRAFETGSVVQCVLAILGSMALQGPLFKWVALHRIHHQYSDQAHDPHTPIISGKGIVNWLRGAWHAHIGWFFDADPPDLNRYVKDLKRSKMLCVVSGLFPLWVALGLVIPAAIGGWWTGSWRGAMLGFLWGGLIRIFLVHHVTWGINSICHLWGQRTYETTDKSRNNFLFGILAMGEGWHNNHHAFPASARHGLKWWQIDMSYWVISLLSALGLAHNLRLPLEGEVPR